MTKRSNRRRRISWPLIAGGLLLIAAALSLTGYNLWDDSRAGQVNKEILAELIPEIPEGIPTPEPLQKAMLTAWEKREAEKPERSVTMEEAVSITPQPEIRYPYYMLDPNMKMPVKTVNGFDYVAKLEIPVLELELPVMDNWDYKKLQYAPCRYTGTPYLENLVICAHNYKSHFGRNATLQAGDEVIVTDMDGNVFRYEVAETETLPSNAIAEMTAGEWPLTLFTCTVGGSARVTVRCTSPKE